MPKIILSPLGKKRTIAIGISLFIRHKWFRKKLPFVGKRTKVKVQNELAGRIQTHRLDSVVWLPFIMIIYSKYVKTDYKVFRDDPLVLKVAIEYRYMKGTNRLIDIDSFIGYISRKYDVSEDDVRFAVAYQLARTQ